MACRSRTTGVRNGCIRLLFLTIVCLGVVVQSNAQSRLRCGDSIVGTMRGGEDTHALRIPASAMVFLQATPLGDDIEAVRIRVAGDGVDVDTCRGVAFFESRGGELEVTIDSCFGGRGDYVLNAQVVSESSAHCGFELECGATPDGLGLRQLGEVDAFRFDGVPGESVELRINDLDRRSDAYLVRVYDPAGDELLRVCRDRVVVATESGGTHTAVVSSCGTLELGDYRIERLERSCPSGPTVTSMAFLPADRSFVEPVDFDAAGRAVYRTSGRGTLIVEGRVGTSARGIGDTAFSPGRLPAFQAIVSRPLGDGSEAVCDRDAMPPGGVPASLPFAFRSDRAAIARVNDLGCRINDGTGVPRGRRDSLNSCVRDSADFVDPSSAIQFCADFTSVELLPEGDTILAARLRDLDGNLGATREIVLRVPISEVTPTPTPIPVTPSSTPLATSTTGVTRTPTRRPTIPITRSPGPCGCDCDLSGDVQITDLIRCIAVALGRRELAICPLGDSDGDLAVSVGELIQGVFNALEGCPPTLPNGP